MASNASSSTASRRVPSRASVAQQSSASPVPRVTAQRTRRLRLPESLLFLVPLFIILPLWANRQHFKLPTPKIDKYDIGTGMPQLSESVILEHARVLSEDIGFRTVGTREHALGDQYVYDQVKAIKAICDAAVSAAPTRRLQCDVDRQEGSGNHRFDMMNKPLYKVYSKLSNIVLRISDGTLAGQADSLLLNAHIDSTVSSPGAADDALPVGIMLELARVLIETPNWSPGHAIVFLFNNAEESLQDASHLFSTQHPWAKSVRAVMNLEAAGTAGPELVFQATSNEMIEAYSHVPYPYASVLASDVFKSGIVGSDTDFRQFDEYLNVTGIDMAIVGHSYFYHTRKDIIENIAPGVAQHFAENVYAIVNHLLGTPTIISNLAQSATPPNSIYFSIAGKWFFLYSIQTAWLVLGAITLASVAVVSATEGLTSPVSTIAIAMLQVLGSVVGAVLGAGITASVMAKLLGASMTWFAREMSAYALYGPPAIAGALLAQVFSARSAPLDTGRLEYATLLGAHFFNLTLALVLQFFGIGSSAIFTIFSVGSLLALLVNTLIASLRPRRRPHVHLFAYAVAQVAPLAIGTEMTVGLMAFIVPLTGRMGDLAPVEHIVAILSSVLGFLTLNPILPMVHRLGRRALLSCVVGLAGATALSMLIFAYGVDVHNSMHPRRLFVLYSENINTQEHHLHLSIADSSAGFPELAHDVARNFAPMDYTGSLSPAAMHEYNTDWDVLYPFSQFLTPYKLAMPQPYGYVSKLAPTFKVYAINDIYNFRSHTRSLTLVIEHPGIIWATIAFDAHVLKWSIGSPPQSGHVRHYIKHASFYGVDSWTLDLVLDARTDPATQSEDDRLQVDFSGINERGSWPGKAKDSDQGPAMHVFEALDAHLTAVTADSVDVMFLNTVQGYVRL